MPGGHVPEEIPDSLPQRPAEREGRCVHDALLVTLAHSRHQSVHVCRSQKLGDVIEGLEDAWEFFGGVPARVILDNLKAAVTKADRYTPSSSPPSRSTPATAAS